MRQLTRAEQVRSGKGEEPETTRTQPAAEKLRQPQRRKRGTTPRHSLSGQLARHGRQPLFLLNDKTYV